MKRFLMILMTIVPAQAVTTNYVIPGAGIVQDMQDGFNPVIPGGGIYQAQPVAAAAGGAQVIMIMN